MFIYFCYSLYFTDGLWVSKCVYCLRSILKYNYLDEIRTENEPFVATISFVGEIQFWLKIAIFEDTLIEFFSNVVIDGKIFNYLLVLDLWTKVNVVVFIQQKLRELRKLN